MNVYFERYALPIKLFDQQPDPALKIIVVIPCFYEPDIIPTLDSLAACDPIEKCEVMIIVNQAVRANSDIKNKNEQTIAQIEEWLATKKPWFNLLTSHLEMPNKDAGVGFARKAGMDEAARRFETIGNPKGLIACFDADSTCARNYFTSLYQAYYTSDNTPVGSSIYYEHPFPEDPGQRNGIIQYELHLRYYVQTLRMAGYPYAFQTVGSSMAVRSDAYQKIGGMNKRKAGEDFYFLHRLIPSGHFTDISETTVYPSARISNRVPFGTGKAMEKWQDKHLSTYETYALESFVNLNALFELVDSLFEDREMDLYQHLAAPVIDFLKAEDFNSVRLRLLKQSRSHKQFRKNFYAFFDGFKVLKYIHFSRDHSYPNQPVVEAAQQLAEIVWPGEVEANISAEELLLFYRSKDRGI